MAKLAGAVGLLVCALVLAISLLVLPGTFSATLARSLGDATGLGRRAGFALDAFILGVPLGLAFGAMVARHTAAKALAVSLLASGGLIYLSGGLGNLHAPLARIVLVECAAFVVPFCAFAVAGNRLFRRVSPGRRIVGGAVAFAAIVVALVALTLWNAMKLVGTAVDPEARLARATQAFHDATSDDGKFYALNDLAKQSFELGRIDDARGYAQELLRMAGSRRSDWNYGNAIHDGNMVLGRIALREGRVDEAKQYLLAAGATPGSPQLNSFGPNMSLARDLLDKGERDVVLRYFELCRTFWELHHDRLDAWAAEVRAGRTPDFGANLVY